MSRECFLQCCKVKDAEAPVHKLALSYGFDHYLYSIRLPVEGGSAIERVITNYAPAWRQRYQANDFASIDPTVQHCMRRVTPIRWIADLYVSAAQKQLREEARRYGVRSGLSIPVLTPREAECLRWVSRGKTNWEMARILAISEHGVAYHLRNLMRKLQVASRHQAVRRAVALGLIDI